MCSNTLARRGLLGPLSPSFAPCGLLGLCQKLRCKGRSQPSSSGGWPSSRPSPPWPRGSRSNGQEGYRNCSAACPRPRNGTPRRTPCDTRHSCSLPWASRSCRWIRRCGGNNRPPAQGPRPSSPTSSPSQRSCYPWGPGKSAQRVQLALARKAIFFGALRLLLAAPLQLLAGPCLHAAAPRHAARAPGPDRCGRGARAETA
mmetsp:Transcript_10142/g.26935  ORF Transcript_10142/g.26935 Transcript_10142/m.26935 type:complete len:201 (-) Transcript_10142:27-629(-)